MIYFEYVFKIHKIFWTFNLSDTYCTFLLSKIYLDSVKS